MSWKDLSYTKKGLVIGVIITLILIIIPSYFAPIANYNNAKGQYEDYSFVTQTCGNNPSDECLANVCIGRGFSSDSCKDEYPAAWRKSSYASGEKPNIASLLIPNIKNGLEAYGMFGVVGLIFLIIPVAVGFVIGKIIDKAKSK